MNGDPYGERGSRMWAAKRMDGGDVLLVHPAPTAVNGELNCLIQPRGAVLNIDALSGEARGLQEPPGGEGEGCVTGGCRLAGAGGTAGPAGGTQPAQGSTGGLSPLPTSEHRQPAGAVPPLGALLLHPPAPS